MGIGGPVDMKGGARVNVCGVEVTTREQRIMTFMSRELEGPMRARSTMGKCEYLASLAAERFGDVPIGRLLQLASETIYRSRLAKGGIYAR